MDRVTMEAFLAIKEKYEQRWAEARQAQQPPTPTAGVPSMGNMMQGREKRMMRDDRRRSLATGDNSYAKEGARDRNQQSSRGARRRTRAA